MENTIKEQVIFQLCENGWLPVCSESLGKTAMISQPKCLLPRLYPTCAMFIANCVTDGDCTIFSISGKSIVQVDKDDNIIY